MTFLPINPNVFKEKVVDSLYYSILIMTYGKSAIITKTAADRPSWVRPLPNRSFACERSGDSDEPRGGGAGGGVYRARSEASGQNEGLAVGRAQLVALDQAR